MISFSVIDNLKITELDIGMGKCKGIRQNVNKIVEGLKKFNNSDLNSLRTGLITAISE